MNKAMSNKDFRLAMYRGKLPMPYGKGTSKPNAGTKPGKFTVNKPTGRAPIRGQKARISKFHASRGKTSVGFTTPRRGSQY